MILANASAEFAIRSDGWIHWIQGGLDVPRGPLGVLLYLVFVPLFWMTPRGWRAQFLAATSLLLGIATVGVSYTLTIAALTLLGFGVVRLMAGKRAYWWGVALLVGVLGWLLWYPQPAWLPPADPLYFYLHWAGLAYLFLKMLHVLNDRSRGKLPPPRLADWFAYILFAPTLRMGPIYRYAEFHEQLHGELARDRQLGRAFVRIVTGLVRLGILGALVAPENFPLEPLFNHPEQFSAGALVLRIYLAPMCFYLWLSGYTDLSVGVGRALGFMVPENFNYPWAAVNIAGFWQRWHIPLSTWLRDYVFNPLVRRRWHFFWAFLVTFLLCGLWHAPMWCYIIWGGAQGAGLAALRVWSQFWKRQHAAHTRLYARLQAWRLVESPLSTSLAWLVTFHYEVLTIGIGVDNFHSGKLVFLQIGRLLLT